MPWWVASCTGHLRLLFVAARDLVAASGHLALKQQHPPASSPHQGSPGAGGRAPPRQSSAHLRHIIIHSDNMPDQDRHCYQCFSQPATAQALPLPRRPCPLFAVAGIGPPPSAQQAAYKSRRRHTPSLGPPHDQCRLSLAFA